MAPLSQSGPDVPHPPRYRPRPPRTFAPAFEALLATVEPEVVLRIRTSVNKTLFDCTTCKNGHVVTPETIRVSPPGRRRGVLTYCRVCMKENRRRAQRSRQKRGQVSRARIERVMEALRGGKTLQEIFGRQGSKCVGGQIINPTLFYAFRRSHPKLDRIIGKLARQNHETAYRGSRRVMAAQVVMRNDGANAYAAVVRATDGLADAIRDDVRADMLLALAEGRLKLRDVEGRVVEFVRAHNRRYTHYAPTGGFMLSIDQPAFDDTTMTIGERVTHNLWGGSSL